MYRLYAIPFQFCTPAVRAGTHSDRARANYGCARRPKPAIRMAVVTAAAIRTLVHFPSRRVRSTTRPSGLSDSSPSGLSRPWCNRGTVNSADLHRMKMIHTLAHVVHEQGAYEWRERRPGDGSGVPDGHLRFEIEVDAPAFWSLYSRLTEDKGWTP